MLTDLLAVTSALSAESVLAIVPPSCRRGVEHAPAIDDGAGGVVVDVPEWAPRRPARHLLPSVSVLVDADVAFRFDVSALIAGAWSPWIAAAPVGTAPFPTLPSSAGGIRADVDVFVAERPVDRVRLRLRATGLELCSTPWLVTLSTCDLENAPRHPAAPTTPGPVLSVPARSQMAQPEAVRNRICSPTSVAMVLDYWKAPVALDRVCADVFDPVLDCYGVWPAAIRAAARRSVAGYLLRFPDWASAEWCLEQGLPVVASVRYGAGELDGAPIAETTGHLLVVTGRDGDAVLVNDPAAPSADTVPRRYRLDQFCRAWLERTGVGYVLFRLG